MVANEPHVTEFSLKRLRMLCPYVDMHMRTYIHTYIPFKLLKSNHWSQARDGLKKTPKILVQMERIFTNNFHEIYKKKTICHSSY